MKKPNLTQWVALFFLLLSGSGLFAQSDSIQLVAHPDTLFAPEADGYFIDLIANDYCLDTETGDAPIDCGIISILDVDASAADGLGIVNWDATTVTFEPTALWLTLDTVIYLPYAAINAGMQTAYSFLVIATDPIFPPPSTLCCAQTPCPGELICNPEFSLPVLCDLPVAGNSYLDVDGTGLFPCWRSIQLTPNGNFGPLPNQGECGVISMWSASNGVHEAMQTTASVVSGQRYLLSYSYLRGGTGTSLDHLITGFTNGPIPAVTGPPTFLIQDHQNITNITKRQMVTCFTPNNNYNNLVVYPQQNGSTTFSQPNISLYNMHLQAFPPANQTVAVFCGDPATLSVPPICIPGAVWTWTDNNGNIFATDVPTVVVNPTLLNQQYTATLSFPGPNMDLINCTGLDVTFTVLIEGDCCCDDFHNEFAEAGFSYVQGPSYQLCAPANVLATDWLSWTFGDGTGAGPVTGVIPCVFHAYPAPGTYLATLTIERILADGDTCSIQLCELVEVPISCADCEDHLTTISNQIDLAVDISNWTPTGGPVNFYPVPVFAPYNVRVLWDFDCDGNIDQTTSGNDPASLNYGCSPQTVCYTVECLESQNTACYGELKVKDFILPCGSDDFCCADFMTDVMDYGISQSLLGSNTYQFCLSPNIPATSYIEWDLNCNGTSFTSTNICENLTLSPGDNELCATVYYLSPQGDTCRAKVNTCLPEIEMNTDTCTCSDPFFTDAVNDGFTWFENPAFTVNFTPISLIDNCDEVYWTWGDGTQGGPSFGNNTITHLYSAVGVYEVCILVIRTEPTGMICEREICIDIDVAGVSATDDVEKMQQIQVYPNPTFGNLIVEIPIEWMNKDCKLKVQNMHGQIQLEVQVKSSEVLIDLSSAPAGMYLISLYDTQGRMRTLPAKVVKQ